MYLASCGPTSSWPQWKYESSQAMEKNPRYLPGEPPGDKISFLERRGSYMNGCKAGIVRLTSPWHGENLPHNEHNSEERRVRNEERQWLTDTVSRVKIPTCDSPVSAQEPPTPACDP